MSVVVPLRVVVILLVKCQLTTRKYIIYYKFKFNVFASYLQWVKCKLANSASTMHYVMEFDS